MIGLKQILTALILLTLLDGGPVWVEATAITIIREAHEQCSLPTATAIRITGSGGLCVQETADQVREKIRNAESHQ